MQPSELTLVARRTVRPLWTVVVPAALAAVVLRYLVPVTGPGVRGVVALVGHRYTALLALGLYLALSATARYWWPRPAAPVRPVRGLRHGLALPAMVAAAVVVALAFRAYVAKPYRVIGESMLPTLSPDDLIAARMRPYVSHGPSRGDLVVFQGAAIASVALPEVVVKRAIGLPGDRISMRGATLVINGWPVPFCDAGPYVHLSPEPGDRGLIGRMRMEFVDDRAYLVVISPGPSFDGEYTVGPGEVFVMGDNRGNSADSRAFNGGKGGGVPLDAIEGNARFFLTGSRGDRNLDFGRLFQPIDCLEVELRLEGVQMEPVAAGIARCLAERPRDTHPSAP